MIYKHRKFYSWMLLGMRKFEFFYNGDIHRVQEDLTKIAGTGKLRELFGIFQKPQNRRGGRR